MCGIFAIFTRIKNIKEIRDSFIQAGNLQYHRGPDDEGCYFDDQVGLYFRRLAIIDVSANGHQPMLSDTGNEIIVFNGEIYNYQELRKELKQDGFVFRSKTDTEVILKLYQKYQENCVQYLRGMFAFIIWDKSRRKLWVFRDRIGIKPLYIYETKEYILFSSEIKSILQFAPQAKKLNERSVFKFLARGWLDNDYQTLFDDIKAVPIGTMLCVSEEAAIRQKKYWELKIGNNKNYLATEFEEQFRQNLDLHLNSDVPLAATLSGGLDSSSLVGVISAKMQNPQSLQAFSVLPPYTIDEHHWITETVNLFQCSHTYLEIKEDHLDKVIQDLLYYQDEPISSSNCIYQFMLRKAMREAGYKVALVGEGGDEVLGGYRRLVFPYLWSLLENNDQDEFYKSIDGCQHFLGFDSRELVLHKLDEFMAETNGQFSISQLLGNNGRVVDILHQEFQREYNTVLRMPRCPRSIGSYPNYFFANLGYKIFERDVPYILRMEDRISMGNSIEARVPFLDHVFIEYVFSHCFQEFMRDGQNKSMMRNALKKYLAPSVVNRKTKSGRPGSNAHLVYHLFPKKIMEMISNSASQQSYFSREMMDLFKQDYTHLNQRSADIWFRIFIFFIWQARFNT